MLKAMRRMNSLIRVLGRVGVFQSLRPAELQAIALVARRQRHGAEDAVFRRGAAGDAMYIIEEGSLKISRLTPSGKEQIIGVLGPGEVIGEMALFDDEPRSADAITLEETILIRIPKQAFLRLLEDIPLLAIRFLAVLAVRLRRMNERLEELTFLTARRRVARLILEMAGRGKGVRTSPLKMRLTQEEMAALVGTSRETVSRVLGELQELGLIYVEGRVLYIKRWEELQALAEIGDP